MASAILDGVNAASLVLMATAAVALGRAAVTDLTSVVIAVGSLVLLVRYRSSSTWLVLGGAVVGLAAGVLR